MDFYISGRRTSHFGFYKLGNFLYKWARELGNPWGTEKLGGEFRILNLDKNCQLGAKNVEERPAARFFKILQQFVVNGLTSCVL
jgi:hypothetical protein